jgi:RNA polymerase sigma-70 factor (ECF subfamily)
LVQEHRKSLLIYAERLLNDHYTAEDIVQETLVRAWRHSERLHNTEGSVRGWLFTVVRNLIIDRSRSASLRYETLGADPKDTAQRDHSDAVIASVQISGLLDQLPREHREVLVHTYLWGRTAQETAKIMGIPLGTVKSRRHYALNALRERVASSAV